MSPRSRHRWGADFDLPTELPKVTASMPAASTTESSTDAGPMQEKPFQLPMLDLT